MFNLLLYSLLFEICSRIMVLVLLDMTFEGCKL